jgi:hypothetical protein
MILWHLRANTAAIRSVEKRMTELEGKLDTLTGELRVELLTKISDAKNVTDTKIVEVSTKIKIVTMLLMGVATAVGASVPIALKLWG